jgi:hypothetical protein
MNLMIMLESALSYNKPVAIQVSRGTGVGAAVKEILRS